MSDVINKGDLPVPPSGGGGGIIVTGAAGSIGSEIVRQLLHYSPELIVLCDQAETPLHSLELELQETGKKVNLK